MKKHITIGLLVCFAMIAILGTGCGSIHGEGSLEVVKNNGWHHKRSYWYELNPLCVLGKLVQINGTVVYGGRGININGVNSGGDCYIDPIYRTRCAFGNRLIEYEGLLYEVPIGHHVVRNNQGKVVVERGN